VAHVGFIQLVLVACVGVAAGFLNIVAGGGSLLTLPIMNFIGIDLGIANATNRVAIFLQDFTAMLFYSKRGEIEWRGVMSYILPVVAGALVGTLSAIYISPHAFRIITAVAISLMGLLLIAKPEMWDEPTGEPMSFAGRTAALFAVGVYGGFLQAGVGFLIIWTIVGGCKMDIKHANILKVILIAVYSVLSIVLFALHGMIYWTAAAALAAGTVAGGNIGARFNLNGDKKHVRYVLTAAVLICAAKILYDALK
jgi:uncharacterized membrane protein YfcA